MTKTEERQLALWYTDAIVVVLSEVFLTGVGLWAEGGYGEISRDCRGDQHQAGRASR